MSYAAEMSRPEFRHDELKTIDQLKRNLDEGLEDIEGLKTTNVRTKADFKPEAFIVGQVVGGDDFETVDGLFVEIIMKHGEGWKPLDGNAEQTL